MQTSENVISIFEAKKKKANPETVSAKVESNEESDFEAVARKNRENLERMRKERSKANKSVLRSHRMNKNN